MKCSNCGAELTDDTKFCSYCGVKITPEASEIHEPNAPNDVNKTEQVEEEIPSEPEYVIHRLTLLRIHLVQRQHLETKSRRSSVRFGLGWTCSVKFQPQQSLW